MRCYKCKKTTVNDTIEEVEGLICMDCWNKEIEKDMSDKIETI